VSAFPALAESEAPRPAGPAPDAEPAPHWSLARRIGFRFLLSYFVLFFLTGQEIAAIPLLGPFVEKYTEGWYAVAVWIGRHLFHIRGDIPFDGSGSGDTTFRWLLLPCYLALAAAVTAVWSLLDRKRPDHERLLQGLRFLLRFSLAIAMISYGLAKVIPNQMPFPRSYILLQRVGELKPMRLLWLSVGASPAYEACTGLAELLGGVLLLVPRTVLLGALVCTADMAMVFLLNLCYDVPVKIMSFHYLAMAMILAAPDLRRLADLLLFDRAVAPPRRPPLFLRPRLDRAAQILFFLFGVYTIGLGVVEGIARYKERNVPRPPLFGVWAVEETTVDGVAVPPSSDPVRDPEAWRFVAFDRPGSMSVELARGARRVYALQADPAAKRLTLGKTRRDAQGSPVLDAAGRPQKEPGWTAELSFAEPSPGALVLDGSLDGHRRRMKLRKMPLLRDRFHWITDPPKE
jgi:uncharacterized membrane protein YphA (DoxX/SURF4 family)